MLDYYLYHDKNHKVHKDSSYMDCIGMYNFDHNNQADIYTDTYLVMAGHLYK